MKRLHKSLVMPYRAEQIYALVADVSAYASFLPWCGGARVLKQLSPNQIEAELVIAKGPVKVAFVTENTLYPSERIQMRLKSGPFKRLEGGWTFEARDDNSCCVTLSLNFEFNNRLLAMTVGAVFEQVIGSLVEAFLERASVLYGRK